MKKFLSILVLSLTTIIFTVDAQQPSVRRKYFEFGPKIGLSAPTLHAVTNNYEVNALLNGLNGAFQVGGFARGMLPVWRGATLYLQADALFAMDFYFGKEGAHASSSNFNFPIVLGGGYRFKDGTFLRGGWGPVFCVNLCQSASTTYEGYEAQICSLLKRNTVGHAADLGVDFKNWAIDLRYMNQFKSNTSLPRVVDTSRYISWGLTVGYRF